MNALVPDVPLGGEVPQHLFQIFLGGPLPAALAPATERLRSLNPDWTYRLFDDAGAEAFIGTHYPPAVLSLYRRIDPVYGAARADLLRYLLIYRLGGVYLDVKSGVSRPFGEVIRSDDRFILAQWRNTGDTPHRGWGLHAELADIPGGEFQQWHVIAAAGHPFLRAVLERVLSGIRSYRVAADETGWLGVLRLTGPIAYTRAIAPLLGSAPHRRVADETALGLTYNVLGGSAHQQLFKRHYTAATSPIVRRPPPWRWYDRAYLDLRARKRRWRATRH